MHRGLHSGGAPQFFHIDPQGKREPYSSADCKAISAARKKGEPSVRISDVTLPNGSVLEFEVRLGVHAVSSRMLEPPPSRMIQVNIATDKTRIVVESLGAPPPMAAPALRGSQDEAAPEPELQTSQVLHFEDVTVELVGTEATTKYNLDIYEEQSRVTMYGTADAAESDAVFHDLEGSFRLAGLTLAEAGGGGFFGQGLVSPFFLTATVLFSERITEVSLY